MLLDEIDVVRLFQNDMILAEVALAELFHDLAVHYTINVAFAYELVLAFFCWREEERNSCPKDDATYIANFDQITQRSYSDTPIPSQKHACIVDIVNALFDRYCILSLVYLHHSLLITWSGHTDTLSICINDALLSLVGNGGEATVYSVTDHQGAEKVGISYCDAQS